jgi:hypothetical protein
VENSVTFDSSLEYGATFRFPVTWSYLTALPNRVTPNQAYANPNPVSPPIPPKSARPAPMRTLEVVDVPPAKVEPPPADEPAETVAAAIAVEAPAVEATPVAEVVALVPSQKPAVPRASGPEAKWEMVIPKMARPIMARAPRALQHALRQPAQVSLAAAADAETPTEISFYAGSEASFLPRRWKVLSLSAAVVVVVCVVAWVRPGSDSGSATETSSASAGTWSRRTAYVTGSSSPREILVYSGSEGLKNYRIEFAWVPDPKGVGWLYRASDSANYYATKLRLLQAGATPMLSAERFAVIKGVEGAHARKVITLGPTKAEVRVRMDATGPAFTLFLQGSPADYWTDERFESGSLGFYEERGERPVVQALRFTLFKKSGLQTVVTSLQ